MTAFGFVGCICFSLAENRLDWWKPWVSWPFWHIDPSIANPLSKTAASQFFIPFSSFPWDLAYKWESSGFFRSPVIKRAVCEILRDVRPSMGWCWDDGDGVGSISSRFGVIKPGDVWRLQGGRRGCLVNVWDTDPEKYTRMGSSYLTSIMHGAFARILSQNYPVFETDGMENSVGNATNWVSWWGEDTHVVSNDMEKFMQFHGVAHVGN